MMTYIIVGAYFAFMLFVYSLLRWKIGKHDAMFVWMMLTPFFVVSAPLLRLLIERLK